MWQAVQSQTKDNHFYHRFPPWTETAELLNTQRLHQEPPAIHISRAFSLLGSDKLYWRRVDNKQKV